MSIIGTELARTGKILNERQGPTFPRVRGKIKRADNLNISNQLFMPLSILKAVFIGKISIFKTMKGGDMDETY